MFQKLVRSVFRFEKNFSGTFFKCSPKHFTSTILRRICEHTYVFDVSFLRDFEKMRN